MTDAGQNKSAESPSRRGVLKGMWLVLWAGLVAAASLGLGAVLRLAGAHSGGGGQAGGPVAFDPQSLPRPGQIRRQGRVALLRDAGGFFALELSCPHLGCRPEWNLAEERFLCPCHGSAFTYDGALLKGPANKGLANIDLERDSRGWLVAHPGRPVASAVRLSPEAG
ncbi:Rieske 2Fe-2S domain-containing protein [Patescibacteria group bacterium]|nr:Rieske 2Fe-2S domain-containing protein [Patescibacteria group bacterium]MBU1449024.1 Rieske 2Fe-2S domain-containing protein [Patescibacteria group bacterium]